MLQVTERTLSAFSPKGYVVAARSPAAGQKMERSLMLVPLHCPEPRPPQLPLS